MKSQPRHIAGHVMWTSSGVPWALWKVTPRPYGYRPIKEKRQARHEHMALLRGLRGESLLLGVCATLDPEALVLKMMEGIELHEHPAWADECKATLDKLSGIGIGQRTYWLAKPLNAHSGLSGLVDASKAAVENFKASAGLPGAVPSATEINRRMRQAREVERAIPMAFEVERGSAAQWTWLYLHAQQRGLFLDGTPPATEAAGDERLVAKSCAALTEPMLDEGGQSDLSRKDWRSWNPLKRKYLKVTQPGDVAPVSSYQSLLTLADVPAGGMLFPGSEFLGRIDESGINVDWAMRLHVRSSEQVARRNQRALVALNEQYKQREGELSTGLSVLDRAADDLTEYAQILESDKNEVETQSTTMFAVADDSAESAKEQAFALAQYFDGHDYRVQQPIGDQEALWQAMLPGTPATRVVREYVQFTTSKDLAASVPFASTELGDDTGPLFAENRSGIGGVVHLDLATASLRNTSASCAFCGEKGSGKSTAMKTLAGQVLDRGGRIIAVDRTPMGEWEVWAKAVTDTAVVDVADPRYSLDPLRLFGSQHLSNPDDSNRAAEAARAAQKFVTTLLGLSQSSKEGVRLRKVLSPAYLAEHGLTSMGQVTRHLLEDCTLPHAKDLGEALEGYADTDLGRAVFDETLPVLDRFTPGIIIRTDKLETPSNREVEHKHLFEQMSIEKVMGRAYYALIGELARQICFEDRTTLAVYFIDEAHHQTRSPEGLDSLILFARDDRKHLAAVVLGSHDPLGDFGDATMRGLIPTRIGLRQTDRTLAERTLDWLNMDAEYLDMLMKDTSPKNGKDGGTEPGREGEGFMRDTRGNIGRIKILAPADPARFAAVSTTPGEATPANRAVYETYDPATTVDGEYETYEPALVGAAGEGDRR